MKIFRLTTGVLCTALLLSACMQDGGSYNREVEIINNTDSSIVAYYGSNVSRDSWEENIIEGMKVAPGSSIMIDFYDGTEHCMFDVRAEFADGDVVEEASVDVCQVSSLTYDNQ